MEKKESKSRSLLANSSRDIRDDRCTELINNPYATVKEIKMYSNITLT